MSEGSKIDYNTPKSFKFTPKIVVKNVRSKRPFFELSLGFGGCYIKAFDHIEGIDGPSHHILVYMGSRLPFDKEGVLDASAWPSIGTDDDKANETIRE